MRRNKAQTCLKRPMGVHRDAFTQWTRSAITGWQRDVCVHAQRRSASSGCRVFIHDCRGCCKHISLSKATHRPLARPARRGSNVGKSTALPSSMHLYLLLFNKRTWDEHKMWKRWWRYTRLYARLEPSAWIRDVDPSKPRSTLWENIALAVRERGGEGGQFAQLYHGGPAPPKAPTRLARRQSKLTRKRTGQSGAAPSILQDRKHSIDQDYQGHLRAPNKRIAALPAHHLASRAPTPPWGMDHEWRVQGNEHLCAQLDTP